MTSSACGSSGGDTSGGGSGHQTGASGTVGTGGGSVSLPGGASVTIPAGALPSSTAITVDTSTVTPPTGAVSPLYSFGPSGTTFASPVTVTFPVPAGTKASAVAVYWTKPGSATEWDVLPTTVDGTTASARVTHFSSGFVGSACSAGDTCTPANPCHAGATTCNGTPACADTGAKAPDGTACGGTNVCTAGVCGTPQCIDMSGAWTITAHCTPAYVGKSFVMSQSGCSISATDPVNGNPFTGTVSGSNVSGAGCQGSVSGSTWNWTCGTCAQTIVRQAACTPGLACTPSATPDVCKTYATTCPPGGAATCAVAGNQPDGTSCGSNLTCQAGVCGSAPASVDATGTWVTPSPVTYTLLDPAGTTVATGSFLSVHDAIQSGNTIQWSQASSAGGHSTCAGTVSGSTISASCSLDLLGGACTGTYGATGTIAGGATPSWTETSTDVAIQGASCSIAGFTLRVNAATFSTSTPAADVSGTYSVSFQYTRTGPGVATQSGSAVGARVRNQSGSMTTSTFTSGDAISRCRGIVFGDRIEEHCYTTYLHSPALVDQQNSGTFALGPPITAIATTDGVISGDPAGYTRVTTTVTATRTSPVCSSLVNDGPDVTAQNVAASMPAPSGGTVRAGTYVLTSLTYFNGPGGATGPAATTNRNKVLLSGGPSGTMNGVIRVNGVDGFGTFSYATSGTTLTQTKTCGSGVNDSIGYTATGDQFWFFHPNVGDPTRGYIGFYTLVGGNSCVAGVPCTPTGTANACQVYATACSPGGVQSCVAAPAPDGTTCGGTNYCAAGTCSRTVTIDRVNTFYNASGTTTEQVTGYQYAALFGNPASPTRLVATQPTPGIATYQIANVPVGTYVLESRVGAAGAPSFFPTSSSTPHLGFSMWGRANGIAPTLATTLTFNFSNMTPWTTNGDMIEFFSPELGIIDYTFGSWAYTPDPWGATSGTTTATGVEDYRIQAGQVLVEPALGDTTWFIQAATKSVPGTALTYQALDRYYVSSTFGIQDGVAQTFDVPFVAPSAFDSTPVDIRMSEFLALAPSVHPAGQPLPWQSGFAVLGYPAHAPGVFESRGGTVDLMTFNPVDLAADANLGTVSWGRILPAPWQSLRHFTYGVGVPFRATNASTSTTFQRAFLYAREPMSATGPVQPRLSPPASVTVNGLPAQGAEITGAGTMPVLAWSAPAIAPAGLPLRYSVQVMRIELSGTGTLLRSVGTVNGISTSPVQLPPGILTAGSRYFVTVTATASDPSGLPTYSAVAVTSPISP